MTTNTPKTRQFRIVITGAPASAKSTIIEQLQTEPSLTGFVFFNELARQLLQENPNWRSDWNRFHHAIYHRQIEREQAIAGRSFITDRGTVDAFAFYPETMQEVNTTLEQEHQRYDLVLHLGSAATLGESFYVQDAIRFENVETALNIEHNLKRVWGSHPGYRFIPAAENLSDKQEQVRTTILQLIGLSPNNEILRMTEHKG